MMTEAELWPLEYSQGFKAIWPSLWSDITHIWTWPRCHQDKHSGILQEDWSKTVVSEVFTRFFYDFTNWPIFDLTWPKLKHDRGIVKVIIVSKLDEDWTNTVAAGVFISFFFSWFNLLTKFFLPDMTHIRIWPRYCQHDHSEQVWWWLDKTCEL